MNEVITTLSKIITCAEFLCKDGTRLWQIQHIAIVLLSKLIRYNMKRAGLVAKIMGSTLLVNIVKSYHNLKVTSRLDNAEKLDPDAEKIMELLLKEVVKLQDTSYSHAIAFHKFHFANNAEQSHKSERDDQDLETLHLSKKQKTNNNVNIM